MKRLSVVVLFIGALVAAALLAWDSFSDSDSGSIDGGIDTLTVETGAAMLPDPGAAAGGTRTVAATEGDEATKEAPSYTRALCGLRGRVIWQDGGAAVADTEVVAFELYLSSFSPTIDEVFARKAPPFSMIRARSRTNAEGCFELTGLHGRAVLALGIGLRTDKAALRIVDRSPIRGQVVNLGDIALLTRGSLTGMVVDGDDKPVQGARIRVLDLPEAMVQYGIAEYEAGGLLLNVAGSVAQVMPTPRWIEEAEALLPFPVAESDAGGRFRIEGVRPGRASVVARRAGKATALRAVRIRSGKHTDIGKFRLRAGKTLRGRFVDEAGEGVAGVQCSAGTMAPMLGMALMRKPVEAATDGTFAMHGLARGDLWLAYRRAEDRPWEAKGPHDAGDEVRVVLRALYGCTLLVRDATDRPVANAQVQISPIAPWPLHGLQAKLDARHVAATKEPGRWRLRYLPTGKYQVGVRAPGLGGTFQDVEITPEDRVVVVRLPIAHEHRFEVVTAAGAAVAGARIYWDIHLSRADHESAKALARNDTPLLLGKTDAKGVLVTDSLEEGASHFVARHPAHALAHSGQQKAHSGRPVRFVMLSSGRVEGRITDHGQPPKTNYTVIAFPKGKSSDFDGMDMPQLTLTAAEGSFLFPHLDPGRWKLVTAPPLGRLGSVKDLLKLDAKTLSSQGEVEVVVIADQTSHAHIELAPPTEARGTASITGTVRAGGKPVVGVVVQATQDETERRTMTGAHGAFRLGDLVAGKHNIEVLRPEGNFPTIWDDDVVVGEGEHTAVHIALAFGTAVLEVVDEAGAPVASLHLYLVKEAAPRARIEVTTGDNGRGKAPDVPAGRYRVDSITWSKGDPIVLTTHIDIDAATDGRVHRLRAVRSVTVRGRIDLDLAGLADAERKLAQGEPPTWLGFAGPAADEWCGVEDSAERRTFEVTAMAPGVWSVYCTEFGLPWKARHKLVVPATDMNNARIVLYPDRPWLQRKLEKQKEK